MTITQFICSMTYTKRRFHCEQDYAYTGQQSKITGLWSNSKVIFLPTWTVYEFVNSPSCQTPVFQGSESECRDWLKKI